MSEVFRSKYRPLDPQEQAKVERIKTLAQELYDEFTPVAPAAGAREMALAKTNLEQAVMWAVKAITG